MKSLLSSSKVGMIAVALALGAGSAGATACGGGMESNEKYDFTTGALMLPGQNCLRCHSDGSPYPEAPSWTLGGTVFSSADADISDGVKGARIEVTDTRGTTVRLTTNSSGNFYTSEPLVGPFRVALEYEGERVEMPIEAPAGSCNACHSHPDPTGGTNGRIRIPQANEVMTPSAVGR